MRRNSVFNVYLLVAIFAVVGCSSQTQHSSMAVNPEITSADLDKSSTSLEWLTYGHDYTNSRFALQEQIDPGNVKSLVPRFIEQTGIAEPIEASPIVSRGVMYFSTWDDAVIAINARSGDEIWRYSPVVRPGKLCCGHVSRGVAVADGFVFVARLDDRLVALDQTTGAPVWSVPVTRLVHHDSMTMAPIVYHDKVIVGVAGGEFGMRGFIRAFSIANGKLLWTWFSTSDQDWLGTFKPRDPCGNDLHRDLAQERRDSPRLADVWRVGGGGVWTTPAVDISKNEIIATVGNPWPDQSADRPGDNLYTDSIVGLDADTGRLRWYFQEVPHDHWDWDPASPPVLIGDPSRDTGTGFIVEAGKTGWVYILDRVNKSLVRCSAAFVAQHDMFSQGRHGDHAPGGGGGANWSPASYDPRLRLLIVMGHSREALPNRQWHRRATEWRDYGTLSAVSIPQGKIVWQRRLPRGSVGGSVSTASGLTFYGDAAGYINAVRTDTGELLWRFQTGAGVNAPPVVYTEAGEEIIAVAAAGNHQTHTRVGDAVIAFGLP